MIWGLVGTLIFLLLVGVGLPLLMMSVFLTSPPFEKGGF